MTDCDCTVCAYSKRHPQLNAPRCIRTRLLLGHGIADIILDLDEPTHERLAAYAKRYGLSVDGAAEQIINEALDREQS